MGRGVRMAAIGTKRWGMSWRLVAGGQLQPVWGEKVGAMFGVAVGMTHLIRKAMRLQQSFEREDRGSDAKRHLDVVHCLSGPWFSLGAVGGGLGMLGGCLAHPSVPMPSIVQGHWRAVLGTCWAAWCSAMGRPPS